MGLRRVAKYSAADVTRKPYNGISEALSTNILEDHVLHSNGISDTGMITDSGNKNIHICKVRIGLGSAKLCSITLERTEETLPNLPTFLLEQVSHCPG